MLNTSRYPWKDTHSSSVGRCEGELSKVQVSGYLKFDLLLDYNIHIEASQPVVHDQIPVLFLHSESCLVMCSLSLLP